MRLVISVLMMVCGVTLAIAGLFVFRSDVDTYSGKAVFTSEVEYQQFKETMAHPDVDILSIQELSSKPPIVVIFELDVPEDSDVRFTYTEPYKAGRNDSTERVFSWVIGGMLVLGSVFVVAAPRD